MTEGRKLWIGGRLAIPESELEYQCSRASGPGGQHVNVTDTAVQLRFHVLGSPSLPDEVRVRLLAIAGRSVTSDGWLLLDCCKCRRQLRNRAAVRERFVELVLKALTPPRPRVRTKVPRISKQVRLELKARRSLTKRQRRAPRPGDDD